MPATSHSDCPSPGGDWPAWSDLRRKGCKCIWYLLTEAVLPASQTSIGSCPLTCTCSSHPKAGDSGRRYSALTPAPRGPEHTTEPTCGRASLQGYSSSRKQREIGPSIRPSSQMPGLATQKGQPLKPQVPFPQRDLPLMGGCCLLRSTKTPSPQGGEMIPSQLETALQGTELGLPAIPADARPQGRPRTAM